MADVFSSSVSYSLSNGTLSASLIIPKSLFSKETKTRESVLSSRQAREEVMNIEDIKIAKFLSY